MLHESLNREVPLSDCAAALVRCLGDIDEAAQLLAGDESKTRESRHKARLIDPHRALSIALSYSRESGLITETKVAPGHPYERVVEVVTRDTHPAFTDDVGPMRLRARGAGVMVMQALISAIQDGQAWFARESRSLGTIGVERTGPAGQRMELLLAQSNKRTPSRWYAVLWCEEIAPHAASGLAHEEDDEGAFLRAIHVLHESLGRRLLEVLATGDLTLEPVVAERD